MLRRFWSAEAGIFLAIWPALMLFGRSTLFRDPGTFWHVVIGERILRTGHLVHADPFSFTFHGKPWLAQQWLAECGMAIVHRLGGWDGLLLVTITLLAGVYTWVASRLIRAGLHVLPVGAVLALVLLASSHQFHVRPLILTIAFVALTFSLLVDVEAGRRRLRQLWWLVPLVVLWANVHGGVLAGLGTIGLVAAGWCLAWMLGRDSPIRHLRDAIALVALLLVCGLSVLVNPYGAGLPRLWLNILSLPLPELIQEHAPLVDLADPWGWLTDPLGSTVVLFGLGYLAALIGVFPKRPRITWLLPLVWFVLACQRVRNAPLFALTAAIALADFLPHARWAKWLERRELFLPTKGTGTFCRNGPKGAAHKRCLSPFRRWQAMVLPLLLVVATLLLQVTRVPLPVFGHGWAKLDATYWPVDLRQELKDVNQNNPEDTRIFNDLKLGGFLIFHTPRLRVFVDDRCALYGSEFLQQYDRARQKDPSQIDRWQRQYGFRYALVETGTPFDRYLKEAHTWTLVGPPTPAATLYRRE